MKDNCLISIIMPAYNAGNYIEASIKSVLNQTYKNWELLIIDDGSTDNTGIICKKYIDQDQRIKYIYQENAKQATARNNGIQNADGEILAFLDSDDLWLPNKLEVSLQHFDLDSFDLFFTDSYVSDKYIIDVFDSEMNNMGIPQKIYFGSEGIAAFIEVNQIPALTVLVKKSAVEQVNFFDKNCVPSEDYDLWLRLLKNNYKFKSISTPLSVYRLHSESSSSADRFVTDMVLKTIMKNFNSAELRNMGVMHSVRKWILRWIQIYLTNSNSRELKIMLDYFGYKNVMINLSFFLRHFVGLNKFKFLLSKSI